MRSKLLNGRTGISPEMAVRLSVVFRTSDQLWVNLQANYDLWKAQRHKNRLHLKPLAMAGIAV